MAKKFDNCTLCNSKKFLNYADLCKQCMRTKESINIREETIAKKLKISISNKKEAEKAEEAKKSSAILESEEGTTDKPEEGSEEGKSEEKKD